MEYDNAYLNIDNIGLPSCITPTSDSEFTAYYGYNSEAHSYGGKITGIIFNNKYFPVGQYESGTYTDVLCIPISDLKHDEWVEFAFPLASILLILIALAMIYHIIFKRLMP